MGKIKINLNKEIAKFKVKFDPATKDITFWKGASRANGHMLFDTGGENYIQFNLAPVPGQDEAEIVGISFESDQGGGIIAPEKVFSPLTEKAIPADPGNNRPDAIDAFGEYDRNSRLFTVANENVRRGDDETDEYHYHLWVHYPKTSNDPGTYYFAHPKIHNEDPPP